VVRHGAVYRLRRAGRAGEGDAGDPRAGGQRRPDLGAGAGQHLQRGARHARLVEERHGTGGDQRRRLGGLGEDRVAGGEGGGHLPREDGEREVPRADAGEDALGRIGQFRRAGGVVAQEIDRLAEFRHGVAGRLARLAREDGQKFGAMRLEEVGGAGQGRGAGFGRGFPGAGGVGGAGHIAGCGERDLAHEIGRISGVADRLCRALPRLDREDRTGGPAGRAEGGAGVLEGRDGSRVAQVHAAGVRTLGREEVCGPSHGGVELSKPLGGERIGGDGPGGHRGVEHLVHEGAVRPVLQEPPHEVGEEVAVHADGRVDPAARALVPHHHVVQRLAHAVQTLELEAAPVHPRHLEDRGDGVGVVGGELRVEVLRVEKPAARRRGRRRPSPPCG
jgi:hypothetical protein